MTVVTVALSKPIFLSISCRLVQHDIGNRTALTIITETPDHDAHKRDIFVSSYPQFIKTHWGRATHICVSKLTIIVSDNCLSPGRRQAITWINDGILLIGPLGTNVSEILSKMLTFSFKKRHLKTSSVKWRPFCLGLNVLIHVCQGASYFMPMFAKNWFVRLLDWDTFITRKLFCLQRTTKHYCNTSYPILLRLMISKYTHMNAFHSFVIDIDTSCT